MGQLLNITSNQAFYLKSNHSFGRDVSHVDVILNSAQCSRLHCFIRYINDGWVIEDKSRNGTYLNGQKLTPGTHPLSINDKIGVSDAVFQWQFIDDEAPKPLLIHVSSDESIPLEQVNVLPSEAEFECMVVQQGTQWIIEQNNQAYPLNGGDTLTFGGKIWTFHPNDILHDTVSLNETATDKATIHLKLDVSLNEENVKLTIAFNKKTWNFGYKVKHQLLLFLARHLLEDKQRHLPLRDLGWLANEVLALEMGVEINNLNMMIYRIRKMFAEVGYSGAIIERRQGEIRLCPVDLTLHKGDDVQNLSFF